MEETIREFYETIKPDIESGETDTDELTEQEEAAYEGCEHDVFSNEWFASQHGDRFDEKHEVSYIDEECLEDIWQVIREKEEKEYEEIKKTQRAEQGYAHADVWNMCDWFTDIIPKMLIDLKNDSGFTKLDRNGNPIIDGSEPWDVYAERWENMLEKMAYLIKEAGADTCSMKNPYWEELQKYQNEFDKKYPDKNILKTEKELEEEKEGKFFLHVGPDRDSETGEDYKELRKQWFNYEKKIYEYRVKCKDEFFELFSKYFFDLWS